MTILRGQVGIHHAWVFPYEDHAVEKVLTKAWYAALERAEIKNFRWHDLRHTWASWQVMRGVPLEVLMRLGGWNSYEMVLRYAHLSQSHIARYVQNRHTHVVEDQENTTQVLDSLGWLTGLVAVQYKGTPEGMTDLIAGRMDVMFIGTQIALPLMQSGRLRVLALTGAKRWKGMPDIPTMQESGFKDYELINWFGLWLPAGASPAIQKKLHAETVKALAAPEVLKQFDAQGLEPVGSTPAEFAKFVAHQSAFINDLARKIERRGK